MTPIKQRYNKKISATKEGEHSVWILFNWQIRCRGITPQMHYREIGDVKASIEIPIHDFQKCFGRLNIASANSQYDA